MIVNISDAKTNLSKLIDMVSQGETIVIAKNNRPIADLVMHKPQGKRKLGLLKGKINIPNNFIQEDADINEMFYGDWVKIIIDTHIFLWALTEPKKLNIKNKQAIETRSNTIYLSSVSIAELMIKSSIGKIVIDFDPIDIAKSSGFELLDFSSEDALALKELPFYHKDPFDRMLISQAMNREFSLMTDDRKFKDYECKLI